MYSWKKDKNKSEDSWVQMTVAIMGASTQVKNELTFYRGLMMIEDKETC